MKPAVLVAGLVAALLGGCSAVPRAGPAESQVVEQGQPRGEILFDVVEVDDRVVSILRAQPTESFKTRFGTTAGPPDFKIAIGDTVSVVIWESAAGGLFSETSPLSASTVEPLAPEPQPRTGQRPEEQPSTGQRPEARPLSRQPPSTGVAVEATGRRPAIIPDQPVGADGAISVPYADRVPAAGRTPAEVQQTIEARLAQKALQPQALVIVKKSAANAVTLTGEPGLPGAAVATQAAAAAPPPPGAGEAAAGVAAAAGVGAAAAGAGAGTAAVDASAAALGPPVPVGGPAGGGLAVSGVAAAASGLGARVPLSPGGNRLLEVIAAAGGAKTPVYETFVRLSRGGVTATIPMARMVSDPAEDIYAQPGDILTLVRVPQTFSVFGATSRNDDIEFGAEKLSLSEALAKSKGLRDDLANPEGVFLFRYEPNSIVRALDQPIATGARDGFSPMAYRFDFKDGKSYFLAHEFPVRDKDIIFVADATAAQVQKVFTVLSSITGPVVTGLVVCRQSKSRC